MTEWLNCKGNLYVTYCSADQVDPRLLGLIDNHGFAFDDSFWYWRPRARRSHKPLPIIKRSPIWTYPKKSVDAEHPKDPFQTKLSRLVKVGGIQK